MSFADVAIVFSTPALNTSGFSERDIESPSFIFVIHT